MTTTCWIGVAGPAHPTLSGRAITGVVHIEIIASAQMPCASAWFLA